MNRKFIFILFLICIFTACSENKNSDENTGLKITGSMKLEYAQQFSVDYCESGYAIITIADDQFLLVPEDKDIPEEIPQDMTVLKQPFENIYLAASSAMDLFDGLEELDRIKMTSTNIKSWSLPNVINAMETEKLTYIGKYNTPDYEFMLSENCELAIESTMIYHSPEVREQIENLGIPVIVERSSYESHLLGRLEWIKLYGLILGKTEFAEDYFNNEIKKFNELVITEIPETQKQTVAFFYISSNGYVNIRKPGDYISHMIELAGGEYIFTGDNLNIDDNSLSTMNIQLETFYDIAKDVDCLIYNSTIDGELENLEQLLEKSSILSDFKAVKEGNVWCTGKNMFQQTTGAVDMMIDMNKVFNKSVNQSDEELTFLYRLN